MFRRTWAGLPPDPKFPSDLEKLGYFVNGDDEVRSIKDPDNYFKYFISRNERWNERQRFAINEALEKVIHSRLEALGLQKVLLPLGVNDTSQPHMPIFVSKGIENAARVVLLFGESTQDLGVLAHRVIGGPGGINKGSMVSIVGSLLAQRSSQDNASPPAVIVANMGQLLWLPSAQRTMTRSSWNSAPMKSAVHRGNYFSEAVNTVPGNRTLQQHAAYVLDTVVPAFVQRTDARFEILGIGDGADAVEEYLDSAPEIWERWQRRLNCIALVGGLYPIWEVKIGGLKEFLRLRSRNFSLSLEPKGMILSGPGGNPNTTAFTSLGCPVFSAGENKHPECLLIAAADIVLDWLQEVAMCTTHSSGRPSSITERNLGSMGDENSREGEEHRAASTPVLLNDYQNPEFQVFYSDPNYGGDDAGGNDWRG